MNNSRKVPRIVYEWSNDPNFRRFEKKKKSHENVDSQTRQSEEEQIRSMLGIFCHGRYRSWVISLANLDETA